MEARAEEIAAHERRLADTEFDGYCDLYAHLARSIAADDELLRRLATLPAAPKVLPILVFAAVHDLVLREPGLALGAWYREVDEPGARAAGSGPARARAAGSGRTDPWPAFRSVVVDRFDELAATMATRVVQTNEVGRSAPLLLALTEVRERVQRPLWLVEIGASAGLNLLLDRFGYTFPPVIERTIGDARSPVQLRCEVRGARAAGSGRDARAAGRGTIGVPPVVAPVDLGLVGRIGIDPRPVDVTDADDRRWLRACLWPGIADRAAHLAAALELARHDPPEIRRGSALDVLDDVVGAIPDDVVPCVLSTWVLAYLSKDERTELHRSLAHLGRGRTVACVTGEYQGIAPWVPPLDERATVRSTVLGITVWSAGRETSRAAARIQPHGRWIEWHDNR